VSPVELKLVVEAALLAAGRPLSVEDLRSLFEGDSDPPGPPALHEALEAVAEDWAGRAVELREVASGWRLQVRREYSGWVGRLFSERPPRYTRALLETLALIAYRQPITRGEIEDVRGVSVSTGIIKTLMEREWIRVLGHRDVPGRPALYGTTRMFLDSFGLQSLSDLPPLSDIKDLDSLHADLFADLPPAHGEEDGIRAVAGAGAGHDQGPGEEMAVDAGGTADREDHLHGHREVVESGEVGGGSVGSLRESGAGEEADGPLGPLDEGSPNRSGTDGSRSE
jgi:segregation and condensation protein B